MQQLPASSGTEHCANRRLIRLAYASKTDEVRRAKAAVRMFYVYLIKSEADPGRRNVGFTTDLKKRIKTRNAGGSIHTAKYRPWNLISYHAFSDKRTAQEFEYYLKTASGRAFANKRFWQ